jgi:pSer/pThr/pTyr-binding forkhead associated (FHA) protein
LGRDKPVPASPGAEPLAELDVEEAGKFPIHRVSTIGRAPDSQVVLNIRSVSRHHARIFYEGGHFWIKDLESGNGTTVNGKRLKLQMLGDGDRVCFGEARAVFRTTIQPAGPARLAHDPLEGSDPLFQDGTPTGGLKGTYPNVAPAGKAMHEAETAMEEIVTKRGSMATERLGAATSGSFTASRTSTTADLESENERLRRLVSQLEHALADANIRIRNLQERLGRKS